MSTACAPTPSSWTAEVVSETGILFNPGHAQLDLDAGAFDPNYTTFVTKRVVAVVRLSRSR